MCPLLGLVLVIFVLWLFIGLRNSAMAAVGIPVAFALSFVLLHQVGASINENTLFGLVLVLGMVVDDAIVVIGGALGGLLIRWPLLLLQLLLLPSRLF